MNLVIDRTPQTQFFQKLEFKANLHLHFQQQLHRICPCLFLFFYTFFFFFFLFSDTLTVNCFSVFWQQTCTTALPPRCWAAKRSDCQSFSHPFQTFVCFSHVPFDSRACVWLVRWVNWAWIKLSRRPWVSFQVDTKGKKTRLWAGPDAVLLG